MEINGPINGGNGNDSEFLEEAEEFNSRVISQNNAASKNISQKKPGISTPNIEVHLDHMMFLKIFINFC